MILTPDELSKRIDLKVEEDSDSKALKLRAIEEVIRSYTNNNFQLRTVRFCCRSEGDILYGMSPFLKASDTIQISESGVNDGLYSIECIDKEGIRVDRSLFTVDHNLITKVVYPEDVKQCAADLYFWKQNNGDKVGIKSETISRHSVTYEDSATLYMGYPIGILNGLNLYRKVRF